MPETRIIKKYPNRRLYDTEESRYITVEDVRKLVLQGVTFRVVDSQSGDDITRNILMQIIIDRESGGEPMFTADMLARFIRFYDNAVQGMFSAYLDQSLKLFTEQQEYLQSQMRDMFSGQPVRSMQELAERNMKVWQDLQANFLRAAGLGGGGHKGSSENDD